MASHVRLAPLPVVLIGFGAIGASVWRLLGEAPDRVRLAGLLLREEPGRDHPGLVAAAAAGIAAGPRLAPLLPSPAAPGEPRALVVE